MKARLQAELLTQYGLVASLSALPGSQDDNFLVDSNNHRFVLKLMHPDCDPALVDMQIKAMRWVNQALPAPIVPEVISTLEGQPQCEIADDRGQPRVAWLISHLPGQLLARWQPWDPRLAAALGACLGHVVRVLRGFSHPHLQRSLEWDLRQAQWLSERLTCIDSTKGRKQIESIARRYADCVLPQLNELPRTPIHGDANDMNVLIGPTGEIAGLIDFGDMVATPSVCEPAIAAAYIMMGEGNTVARGAGLVAGFHGADPLSNQALSLLPDLIQTRWAVSVTNAAYLRQRAPENSYLSISERAAWAALSSLGPALKETLGRAIDLAIDQALAQDIREHNQ